MLFWIIALTLCLVVVSFIFKAARQAQPIDAPGALDVKVYREQLNDVARDLARGVIQEEEAERLKTEISRRILAADARASKLGDRRVTTPHRVTLALLGLVALGGGVAGYLWLGAPGYPDMPLDERFALAADQHSGRPTQQNYESSLAALPAVEVDPDFAALVAELREALETRPDDLRGFELLARNEALLGNYAAAYAAQERVLALKADESAARDYAQLARLMISAAQGYVSPEAEIALLRALTLDPNDGFARYYMGVTYLQNGRPDRTFAIWRQLLEDSPADAPWLDTIFASMEELAWVAGVPYEPPALPGPDAADIAAANELSAEDRAAMIEGMVSSLAQRLATEGGDASEWARLISAYGVLGRVEDAKAIWDEAQQVFGADQGSMDIVQRAAQQSGLLEN